jgi:hypothetical protein
MFFATSAMHPLQAGNPGMKLMLREPFKVDAQSILIHGQRTMQNRNETG